MNFVHVLLALLAAAVSGVVCSSGRNSGVQRLLPVAVSGGNTDRLSVLGCDFASMLFEMRSGDRVAVFDTNSSLWGFYTVNHAGMLFALAYDLFRPGGETTYEDIRTVTSTFLREELRNTNGPTPLVDLFSAATLPRLFASCSTTASAWTYVSTLYVTEFNKLYPDHMGTLARLRGRLSRSLNNN